MRTVNIWIIIMFNIRTVCFLPFLVDCLQSSILYIHQNFLKVDVHVIIVDEWYQTARFYEIQALVIYSRAILVAVKSAYHVAVMSAYHVKRVIYKTWSGTLTNSADTDQTPQNALLKLQEVKDQMKQSPFGTIFSAYPQRQSTHQCCQCFACAWDNLQSRTKESGPLTVKL